MVNDEEGKRKICKHCRYYVFDTKDYVCVNDKSDYCGDWPFPWDSCGKWEEEEKQCIQE